MAENEVVSENFKALQNDPEMLLKIVNKYVRVQLIKNNTFCGYLHSIDPVSKSVILLVSKDGAYFSPVIVLGHAVLNIKEEFEPIFTKVPLQKVDDITEIDLQAKKKQLMDWLKFNMLPSYESGENIVFRKIVHLLPPYSVKDICTTNTTVAMELKKVIDRMPPDFHLNLCFN